MSSSAFTAEFLKESAQLIAAMDGAVIDRVADGLGAVRDAGGRLFILGVGGSPGMPATPSMISEKFARSKRTRRPTTCPN